MANVILYYAHPGHIFSHVNAAMFAEAQSVEDITIVDLYHDYPRFDIDPDKEQQRLLDHDMIVFQFPFFWYSTPSILKEWLDIVLEQGFAYGTGGTKLAGKGMLLALSAAGPEDAYTKDGYQRHHLRTFLRPLEQTAGLCKMRFLPPYVLYGALNAPKAGQVAPHVEGYRRLLQGLCDGLFEDHRSGDLDVLTHDTLPLAAEV